MADRVLKTTINAFKTDTAGTYTLEADPTHPVSLNGVFDKPSMDVDPQTGAAVQSTQPSFGIRLADLPSAPNAGDTLILNAITYRVIEVEEDGQGGAELILGRIG